MRAMVLHELGGPVVLEEREPRPPGFGEVLVKMKATGVGLTVAIMKATAELVTELPRIPGHEIAGDVVEVGEGVTHLQPGDRVIILSHEGVPEDRLADHRPRIVHVDERNRIVERPQAGAVSREGRISERAER